MLNLISSPEKRQLPSIIINSGATGPLSPQSVCTHRNTHRTSTREKHEDTVKSQKHESVVGSDGRGHAALNVACHFYTAEMGICSLMGVAASEAECVGGWDLALWRVLCM